MIGTWTAGFGRGRGQASTRGQEEETSRPARICDVDRGKGSAQAAIEGAGDQCCCVLPLRVTVEAEDAHVLNCRVLEVVDK